MVINVRSRNLRTVVEELTGGVAMQFADLINKNQKVSKKYIRATILNHMAGNWIKDEDIVNYCIISGKTFEWFDTDHDLIELLENKVLDLLADENISEELYEKVKDQFKAAEYETVLNFV